MDVITKLVDGDSYRALLNQGALSWLRMAASQESFTSIRYLIKKFLTATAKRVAKDTITRIRFAPPCSLTAGLLKRYYEFLGVDISISNGNASETKANESFDNDVFFDIDGKQNLFQSEANMVILRT